jgi:CHAD domain-containing protein
VLTAPLVPTLGEFVLVGDSSAPGQDLPQLDDGRFSLAAAGKPATVHRTWLDTFDWRLFRAGLTLELITSRGSCELVLTGRDGDLVAAEKAAGQPRWPGLIDLLPAGPLRERLAPVVGVRALLPVTKATSTRSELRALNTDEKTIAMLALDRMTVTAPQRGTPPARLAVLPLRGYLPQAQRLADALAGSAGVAPAQLSPFETALSIAGRRPGDYTSKIVVRLTSTMPAGLALGLVLGNLSDTMTANLPGTIADLDAEFLHDLRVAVRRTRSVLKMTGAALPADLVARYRPEFKWLGDLTTPTRDLDVYLLGYPAMIDRLVAAGEADLLPFQQFLAKRRALAFRQLTRGLRSPRFKSMTSSWRQDLDDLMAAPARRPVIGPFAAKRIEKAHQRVLRSGAAIDQASPPTDLHELRKRCKELRYLLEVFGSLHDPAGQWRAVNELKALQDCLGEFQDTDVQLSELRAFADAMLADHSAPAHTLLAMGEIAGGLGVRQHAARQEFAGRFAEFASPRGRAKIEALTGAQA